MATTQEDEWGEPYRQADLAKEEHERLVAELRAEPGLLRNLLKQTSQENQMLSASLLFDQADITNQAALDERLRKYLLRDETLTQEDIARLEEFLLEDERYFDRMLLVENELIEDYLRGALPAEEEQRFKTHFLVTPERREKLRYLRALAMPTPVAAPEKVGRPAPVSATSSRWRSLFAFVRTPKLATAVAVTVVLFLIFGALLWLIRQPGRHEPLLAEDPTKGASQNSSLPPSPSPTKEPSPAPTSSPGNEQLTKPDGGVRPAPSKPTPPASPPTVFALVSGVLRGGGVGAEKKIEPGSKFVEFHLRLDLEVEYSEFSLAIEDSNGHEVVRRGRVKMITKGGLPTIVASFPAALFKPDDYMVILNGKTNGEYKEVDRYSFRILK
jgi:hypothetical protein